MARPVQEAHVTHSEHSRLSKRLLHWTVVLALMGLALPLVGACGDDRDDASSDESSTSTDATTTTIATNTEMTTWSGERSICGTRDDLEDAILELTSVDVAQQGTEGLDQAVAAIDAVLDQAQDAAGGVLGPETDALRATVDNLAATMASSSQSADAPAAALNEVFRSEDDLVEAARDAC